MDRLQSLEVFIAVAEEGGFAGAARRLGLSAPSATRGVNALEARLGTRLFSRTTRQVHLTDVGETYLEEARHILGLLQSADDAAAGAATRPHGRLRITCPNEFGRIHVMPVVTGYLDTYPEVSADIVMIDRIVNIVEEGFDIAVRIGPLQSSGLTAVRIGQVRRVVCAAPAYLAEIGTPQTPQDLHDHRVISAGPVGPLPDWRFGGDRPATVCIASRLAVSNIAAGIEVACQGWGLCRALSYQVAPHVEAGTLRAVLEEYEPDPLPVHLVHVEGRRAAAKVRSFLDYAAPRLRALPVLA